LISEVFWKAGGCLSHRISFVKKFSHSSFMMSDGLQLIVILQFTLLEITICDLITIIALTSRNCILKLMHLDVISAS
jgi:hypothetical protein